jgi:hypothetical protein
MDYCIPFERPNKDGVYKVNYISWDSHLDLPGAIYLEQNLQRSLLSTYNLHEPKL